MTISGLFKSLPVRRKEFERNSKREFGKALGLLTAYALVPCAQENKGVRLSCTNISNGCVSLGKLFSSELTRYRRRKTPQIKTDGSPSIRASVSSLWGPKTLESIVPLNLDFEVETEKSVRRTLDR